MGSLIGTSLLTLIVFVVAASALKSGNLLEAGLLMLYPFLIGLVCALAGLVVFGLPLTLWLRRKERESRNAYLSGGLIGGAAIAFAIPWIMLGGEAVLALLVAFFGALTGGATGHFWWRYARQEEVEHNLSPLVEVFE